MQGIAPQTDLEGMLATQTVATHNLVMELMRRSAAAEYAESLRVNGNLSTKLLRLFTE
ncbi:MAG: hypothetical protein ACE5MM_06710 [Nitrospiraceae bacterium]